MLARLARSLRLVRRIPGRGLGIALTVVVCGCGTPNPDIVEAREEAKPIPPTPDRGPSEQQKIDRLIEMVRQSDLVFVQNGNERDGRAAADFLDMERRRHPAGFKTAEQYVEQVAAGPRKTKRPWLVRLSKDEAVLAIDWYKSRLEDLETARDPDVISKAATGGEPRPDHTAELRIVAALDAIERSGLTFIAPARKGKGKDKEYTAVEFADMLRSKWQWLGADIHDVDTFVEEIATDSFSSFEPYRVRTADGKEVVFKQWLESELTNSGKGSAQGSAP